MEKIRYRILGETFNTEKAINRETEAFIRYLQRVKTSKKDTEHLWDFAKKRKWPVNSVGTPHSGDLKAIHNNYELEIGFENHPSIILKLFLYGTVGEPEIGPDGKYKLTREAIENKIAEKRRAGLKKEESRKALELHDKRNKALDELSESSNDSELKRNADKFIKVHKEFLKACGYKPCGAGDCTKPVKERRSTAIYCCDACKNREKNRRHRKNNPKSNQRAQLNYLKDLEEEGDLDPVK